MDTFSHGLYGAVAFGRKSRKAFWLAFAFGVLPDILVFGPRFVQSFLDHGWRPGPGSGPPPLETLPSYIFTGYNLTHSLVIFVIAFALVWFIRKKPLVELLSWPLHILVDIPTHSGEFFPTPFLWPIADVQVNGVSWSDPEIFIPNVILVSVLSLWVVISKYRSRKQST